MSEASIRGKRFFCSWSGGKDSALAFHRAVTSGGIPLTLLTMLHEEGGRSRSHGLPISVLKAQAEAMDVKLETLPATWSSYESVFTDALKALRISGVGDGVFGDIDLQEHREWVRKVCSSAKITPHHPLWGEPRRDLLNELLRVGFKQRIVAVKKGTLDRSFLGRTIDLPTIEDLESEGVDASGELGEYHTLVTDGPIFGYPLRIRQREIVERDGYLFLDVSLDEGG